MKIYNGVRFVSSDMDQIMEVLKRLQAKILADRPTIMAQVLARHAARILDTRILKTPIDDDGTLAPWMLARRQVEALCEDMVQFGYRNPPYDTACTMSIFWHRQRAYGLLFTEQAGWRTLIEEADGLEEFCFWTDPAAPEEGSEDWQQRGRVWEALLAPHDNPSYNGLKFDLAPEGQVAWGQIRLQMVLSACPTHEDRVRERAYAKILRQILERMRCKTGITDITRLNSAAIAWMASPVGQRAFFRIQRRIAQQLPTTITETDLCQDPLNDSRS